VKPNHRARCARINRLLIKAYEKPEWPGPQNPIDCLVSTILSQNTTSTRAAKTYATLKRAYPEWDDVASADPEAVAKLLRSGGLAKTKSRVIINLLRDLKKERGTATLEFIKTMSVREAMRAFEAFEGVGPKTGACVLLFALGREICPVDTHLHRILQRMGIIPAGTTPEAAFELLQPLVPKGQSYPFHVNLIRLGREVCRAGKPRCSACPVETECRYAAKNLSRSRGRQARRGG
jgi:endonuclease-3